MRLENLFENSIDDLEDMDLSDALFVLAEMADDEALTDTEIDIIEDMFDRFFDEEDDENQEEE